MSITIDYATGYGYNEANNCAADHGRGYRVYRNLHAKSWSVQGWIPGRGWRVIAHATSVRCPYVTFEVNEAARLRVVASKKKNVHAYAKARDVQLGRGDMYPIYATEITYSPYTDPSELLGSPTRGSFYIDGPMLPIGSAITAWLTTTNKVFVG
jgi:hypothetical protein